MRRCSGGWFEGELGSCKREERVVLVVRHYPPFLFNETEEPCEYSLKDRERMLSLLKRHDIHHYLAGHVHETIHGRAKELDLHTWIVAGTAMSAPPTLSTHPAHSRPKTKTRTDTACGANT
ncbi:hypothetical protein M427DRAFT_324183 [Gonapodya prolifera JEL478]|uniref:Calcineurin-like phosphoesterase domain-containing protein n=1 Tax=Gonapodya prolifera (strain JEL478) TaxID=1344416 RepID=A0A139AEY0_GONPJ|nr:hypothetical protein M427DRAFT_324183 [Gonapodya prolifera JEL478]|eukprot:KXS15376.1 hypothetical protein M427DRAFT_324183 [Gonapodya prolifera JEL478]